jgi:hypothetical protein
MGTVPQWSFVNLCIRIRAKEITAICQDRGMGASWRSSVKKGLLVLGILTKLNGVNVGILITSSYVDPVRFCRGGIFLLFPPKKPKMFAGRRCEANPHFLSVWFLFSCSEHRKLSLRYLTFSPTFLNTHRERHRYIGERHIQRTKLRRVYLPFLTSFRLSGHKRRIAWTKQKT